jgi:hypothetical protein
MITPSWADYGTHDEAYYPGLWHGCTAAWCPALGSPGDRVLNLANPGVIGSLVNGAQYDSQGLLLARVSNQYAIAGTYPSIVHGVNDFTIFCHCFAKTRVQSGSNHIIGNGNTSGIEFLQYLTYLTAFLPGGIQIDESVKQSFSAGIDYYLAFVRKGYVISTYMNGVFLSYTAGTLYNFSSTSDYHIGAQAGVGGGLAWDGWIKDIRMYNRALPVTELDLLSSHPEISYIPRRRTVRRTYSIPATFNPAWARHSNIYITAGARL